MINANHLKNLQAQHQDLEKLIQQYSIVQDANKIKILKKQKLILKEKIEKLLSDDVIA